MSIYTRPESIVERHGGSTAAFSELDEAAAFRIEIPRVQAS